MSYSGPASFNNDGIAEISRTDAGTTDMGLVVSDFANVSANFTDVKFVLKDADAYVTINPATLTVTTNSASKTYDGNALTAGGSISGFVNDELAALSVTGSQTAVGSSTNGYSIDWENSDTAKESNYTIVENLGTLTVNQQGGGSSTETTTTTTTTTTETAAAPAVLGATRTITEEPAVLGATRDTEETPAVLGATRNPSTGDATNGAARALVIIICAGAVGFLASTKRKKNGKN